MENNLPINVTMKNNGITLKLDYNPNEAELYELLTSIDSRTALQFRLQMD